MCNKLKLNSNEVEQLQSQSLTPTLTPSPDSLKVSSSQNTSMGGSKVSTSDFLMVAN